MFCSKCGSQVNTSLNYCNICGAKTAKENNEEGKVSPLNGLITTISFVALGGFGILTILLLKLLDRGVTHEAVGIIAVAYLTALIMICFSLTRVMLKLIDTKKQEKTESRNEFFPPVQLPVPNTAQLEEARQPFSVVDNTTRTFEKIPLKEN